ncbi:hypothetical protein I4U23_024814 [Adineta vaga]|nr:hypothetical protein I4U23_024814 [Adineta vaga]
MSSKSKSFISPLPSKRKVRTSPTSVKHVKIELISKRHTNIADQDEIIRSRLLYEGDHGNDDRRILTLMKLFNSSPFEIEKLHSLLYSVEHSYQLLKSSIRMNEHEQITYAVKTQRMYKQVQQLRHELTRSEERLTKAKQRRSNLLEYDRRIDKINQLDTRKQLRTQQINTLERKRYFEHLQQTFEANFQQRLRQIAIYMRPIFEFDEILKQDIHEDGLNESIIDLLTNVRQRTYSDSSMNSIDGDDYVLNIHSNTEKHKKSVDTILFKNNHPHPLFSNDVELYGTQLMNPLLLLSSSMSSRE